jgi:hypothetical protein
VASGKSSASGNNEGNGGHVPKMMRGKARVAALDAYLK